MRTILLVRDDCSRFAGKKKDIAGGKKTLLKDTLRSPASHALLQSEKLFVRAAPAKLERIKTQKKKKWQSVDKVSMSTFSRHDRPGWASGQETPSPPAGRLASRNYSGELGDRRSAPGRMRNSLSSLRVPCNEQALREVSPLEDRNHRHHDAEEQGGVAGGGRGDAEAMRSGRRASQLSSGGVKRQTQSGGEREKEDLLTLVERFSVDAKATVAELKSRVQREMAREATERQSLADRLALMTQQMEAQRSCFQAQERDWQNRLDGALAKSAAQVEEMADMRQSISDRNSWLQECEMALSKAHQEEKKVKGELLMERSRYDAELEAMSSTVDSQRRELGELRERVETILMDYNLVSAQLQEAQEQNSQFSKQIDVILKQMELIKEEKNALLVDSVPAPTGSVTLVFTDVEASTAQWEWDPQAMGEALRVHNQLFRELLREHKGYEVKTEGDSFICAFSDPKTALKFCLGGQERLLSADWPPKILQHPKSHRVVSETSGKVLFNGLRVRMGMHTGWPSCEADPVTHRMDYFGPVVNRAARIACVGHGGEIVISGESREQLRSGESADWINAMEMSDLGMVGSLKGLRESMHVYAVLPASLRERVFEPAEKEEKRNLEEELVLLKSRNEELARRLIAMDTEVRLAIHSSTDMLDDIVAHWAGTDTEPSREVMQRFTNKLQDLYRNQTMSVMALAEARQESSELAKKAADAVEQQQIFMEMEKSNNSHNGNGVRNGLSRRTPQKRCGLSVVGGPLSAMTWLLVALYILRMLLWPFIEI